jgi:hypothetical protein
VEISNQSQLENKPNRNLEFFVKGCTLNMHSIVCLSQEKRKIEKAAAASAKSPLE